MKPIESKILKGNLIGRIPEIGDKVTINGQEYTVRMVTPPDPSKPYGATTLEFDRPLPPVELKLPTTG